MDFPRRVQSSKFTISDSSEIFLGFYRPPSAPPPPAGGWGQGMCKAPRGNAESPSEAPTLLSPRLPTTSHSLSPR